jgi:hypothetical protein
MYVSLFASFVPYQAIFVLSCAGKPCGSARSLQESRVFSFTDEGDLVIYMSVRELFLTTFIWAIIFEKVNALADKL